MVFDTVASVGSLVLGFPYAKASFGSFLIYLSVGFWAARIKSRPFSLLVGLVAGLADATLGWGVSWVLGLGSLPPGSFTASQLAVAGASAVFAAVVLASNSKFKNFRG